MLNDLHIHNYRLFRELKVPKFRRINSFIGKNNVGKTSLLEALHLLHGSGDPRLLDSKDIIRDFRFDTKRVDVTIDVLWKPLFGDLKIEHPIIIEGQHGPHRPLRLEILLRKQQVKRLTLTQYNIEQILSRNYRSIAAVMLYKDGDKDVVETSIQEAGDSSLELKDAPSNDLTTRSILIAPNNQSQHMDAMRLAAIRQQKMAEIITELLKSIDPKIEGIEDNSSSGVPAIWVDIGLRELVPLSVIGNGIVQILRMLIAILSCPNGIVLIDEIENGLHHSILPNLWKAINEASKKFNVQVVSTCHSYECVSAMSGVIDEEEFYVYRLQRQNDETRDEPRIECIEIEPQVLQTAIEYGMEIR